MEQPRVIFLDAVGTLFGVRGSVGEIYSALALSVGVQAHPEAVNQAFFQSFQQAPPPVFPGVAVDELPPKEWAWWQAIARATFTKVGVIDQFSDFSVFFEELYQYFATFKPWYVYSDVIPTLTHWQNQGIELGIISNFDTRLYGVLEALNLKEFFDTITISSMVGASKPDPQIFRAALAQHDCPPAQAWHIGDSLAEDYQGSIAVGMQGFLINRSS